MKKHMLTRALSLILVLAMFCSLLVLPVAAGTVMADVQLRFTGEDGNTKLTGTIRQGETVMAHVISVRNVEITAATFNVQFNGEAFSIKPFGKNNKTYADTDGEGLGQDNFIENDKTIRLVYSVSDEPETFNGESALMYFYLTANRDVELKELPSLLTFLKQNGDDNDCSYIVNDQTSDSYTCTFNVCPYMTIGYDQSKLKYHNNTHVSDLKKALSIQAYTVAGVLSYKADSIKIYTNADADKPLADADLLVSGNMTDDPSGKNNKVGTFYVEVTTADGVTLGKELRVTVPMDEVERIEVTPAEGGYQYEYVYTDEDHKGFQLKPGSYNAVFVYKSGTCDPATGSVSCSLASIGVDTELTLTHDGTGLSARVPFTRTEKYAIDVPTVDTVNYTGTVQRAPITTSAYYTVGGTNNATNAGDYTATLTLTDPTNVCWNDETGGSDTRNLNWTIAPATGYLTVSQKGIIYTSTTVEQICANYLERQVPNTSTLSVLIGTVTLYKDKECTQQYAATATFAAGTHPVYYKFTTENANYADVTGPLTLNVLARTVTKLEVTGTPKTTYTYGEEFDPDGLTVTASYSDGTNEIVTDQVAWNKALGDVGTNKTVTGTFGDKTVNLPEGVTITVNPQEINQSILDVTLSAASFQYNGGEQKPTVTVSWNNKTLDSDQYVVTFPDDCTNFGTKTIAITKKDGANYKINGTKNATYTITARPVTISGIELEPTTFNGGKNATITNRGTVNGVLAQDSGKVTVANQGTATYDSELPGERTVTFENFRIEGEKASNYSLQKQPDSITATIAKKEIEVSALTVKDKAYNGTKTAEVNTITFSGEVTSQTTGSKYQANLDTNASTAEFAEAGVGTHNVTFNLVLTSTSQNYYTLKPYTGTVQGEITKRTLTGNTQKTGTLLMHGEDLFDDPTIDGVNNEKVTGTFTYSYDGKTSKTDISSALRTAGVKEGGYNVGFTFTPATDGNYTGTVTGTLTITVQDVTFKRGNEEITSTSGMFQQGSDKTYCAKGPDYYVSIYQKDTLKAYVGDTEVPGTFYYTVDGTKSTEITKLTAADHHKFQLYFSATDKTAYPTDIPVGSESDYGIWHAVIKVEDGANNGITVTDRQYDGTTNVATGAVNVDNVKFTIVPSTGSNLTAIPAGDEVKLAYTTATYDDADAGDRTVTLDDLRLTGADAANYTLQNNVTTLPGCDGKIDVPAKITPKGVTITDATVEPTRGYNGGTEATITNNGSLSWKYSTDNVTITAGTATYADKNVGEIKTVTFSGFALTGTDAGNYNLTAQPADATAAITAKELRITNFTVKDKVYDGNDIAEIVSIETDALKKDDVKCQYMMARFDTANAGTAKAVTLSYSGVSTSLTGADAGNYKLNTTDLPTGVTATIHRANLTGAPTFDKVTKAGTKLSEVTYDLSGIKGVNGEDVSPAFSWTDAADTVIEANKSYSWTISTTNTNYESPLTGSVVLYPVSTSYSEQVKKQSEEFEAKKRGELPEDELDFRDVYEDDYFFDAVQWAAENGITGGVGNDRFGPNLDCSRGQTMTFLWRASGEPEPDSFSTDLTDVAAGSYYYEAVLWAMQEGVTTGAGGNRFAPDATVTRGQFVTFLYRLAGASSDGVHPFADVPAGSYYEKAIAWAFAEGITRGTSGTTFSPDAPCTRAQIITFLYRYFNR